MLNAKIGYIYYFFNFNKGIKMNEIDLIKDLEMSLEQITSLCELMLEVDIYTMPNVLTIMELAERGLNKIKENKNLLG